MKILPGGHVRFDRLERVAAEEAAPRERERVLRHLEGCVSCRARYNWLRSLPDRLVEATSPPLPSISEERILARRAAGERVILPVRDGDMQPRRLVVPRRLAAASAGILAVAVVAWFTVVRPSLPSSDRVTGELIVEQAAPRPGDLVTVTYRPSRELMGSESLVLRGVVVSRPLSDRPAALPGRLTVLVPENGAYRGRFPLRVDDVYVRLVVESADGTVVDPRGGDYWHIYAHRESRPLRDALRAHVLLAESWVERDEVLTRATNLYPDDPWLQAARLSHELAYLVGAERDSVLLAHRARLERLSGGLERRDSVGPERLAGLASYAHQVGDSSSARRFVERLIGEYPSHPEAISYRVAALPEQPELAEADRFLDELESMWNTAGPHAALSRAGLEVARLTGRPDEILRWADRSIQRIDHIQNPSIVPLILAETPALGEKALSYLRTAIRHLDAGEVPRPLGLSVDEHRRANRAALRPLLTALGEQLLAEGNRRAALDTLRVAASIDWSSEVHARLAEIQLMTGDTASAATSLARAAAPPFREPADATRFLPSGSDLVPPEEWEILRRAARDELRRDLLAGSVDRKVHTESLYLVDDSGRRHPVDELRHGTVTVVAFWEPRSAAAQDSLPKLRRVTYLARALGGEVLVVTHAPPDDVSSIRPTDSTSRLPLYFDPEQRLAREFGVIGAPEYYVLGYDGHIRFAASSLDDVLMQVDALLEEPRLKAASTAWVADDVGTAGRLAQASW